METTILMNNFFFSREWVNSLETGLGLLEVKKVSQDWINFPPERVVIK